MIRQTGMECWQQVSIESLESLGRWSTRTSQHRRLQMNLEVHLRLLTDHANEWPMYDNGMAACCKDQTTTGGWVRSRHFSDVTNVLGAPTPVQREPQPSQPVTGGECACGPNPSRSSRHLANSRNSPNSQDRDPVSETSERWGSRIWFGPSMAYPVLATLLTDLTANKTGSQRNRVLCQKGSQRMTALNWRGLKGALLECRRNLRSFRIFGYCFGLEIPLIKSRSAKDHAIQGSSSADTVPVYAATSWW